MIDNQLVDGEVVIEVNAEALAATLLELKPQYRFFKLYQTGNIGIAALGADGELTQMGAINVADGSVGWH